MLPRTNNINTYIGLKDLYSTSHGLCFTYYSSKAREVDNCHNLIKTSRPQITQGMADAGLNQVSEC